MNSYPIIILFLTLTVITAIVLGAEDPDVDCLSCHSGSAPKGDYRIDLPHIQIIAPGKVDATSTFQVLVMLTYDGPYDIVSPSATIYYDRVGSGRTEATSMMEDMGQYHSAVFRVEGMTSSGEIRATVAMVIHYDHPDPDEADVASFEVSASARVGVKGAAGDDGGGDRTPERSTSSDDLLIAVLVPLVVLFIAGRRVRWN